MTSCHGPVIIRTVFLNQHCTYCETVFLTDLVEAENVSPYHGILINTGMGNPTAPSKRRLGNKQVYRASGEAQDPCFLYKGIKTPSFTHAFFLCASVPSCSSPSAQASAFSIKKVSQKCTDPRQEASGWPLPFGRRISKRFGRPCIWPRKLATVFRQRDRSSLLRNPMRGLYSSLIFSAG